MPLPEDLLFVAPAAEEPVPCVTPTEHPMVGPFLQGFHDHAEANASIKKDHTSVHVHPQAVGGVDGAEVGVPHNLVNARSYAGGPGTMVEVLYSPVITRRVKNTYRAGRSSGLWSLWSPSLDSTLMMGAVDPVVDSLRESASSPSSMVSKRALDSLAIEPRMIVALRVVVRFTNNNNPHPALQTDSHLVSCSSSGFPQ